jgi:hypothetical protein
MIVFKENVEVFSSGFHQKWLFLRFFNETLATFRGVEMVLRMESAPI